MAAPAKLIGQQEITPTGSIGNRLSSVEHRKGTYESMTQVARGDLHPIEATHKEDIGTGHLHYADVAGTKSAFAREREHRGLHARVVPAIPFFRELGDPESLLGFDYVFRPSSSEGCTWLDELGNLGGQ